MPRSKLPSYRLHKPSGQAVVTLNGKDHYLGPHGSEASKAEYDRVVGVWVAAGRKPLVRSDQAEITVNELLLAYWTWAQTYYLKNGEPTSQLPLIKRSLRPVAKLFGTVPVSEFGPIALKAVRQSMLDKDVVATSRKRDPATGEMVVTTRVIRKGLSRGVCNANVDRIRQAFRWGVSEEMIPQSVYASLMSLRSLAKGRTEARDFDPVGPAPPGDVEAVRPLLLPAVRAMVDLQLLSGMRPGEVVLIRAVDIDRSGEVWSYVPGSHKTEHHGKARTIFLGPRAQAVLAPWLLRHPEGYLFRPKGFDCDPKPRKTDRRVGERYEEVSYYRAIRNACDKAGVARWRPNQLRHNAGTLIRREFGLDAARVVLGHSDARTSEVYAERDTGKASEVAKAIG